MLSVDPGQILVLATLGSMLIAGFLFVARQMVALKTALDERLTVEQYEKRNRELGERLQDQIVREAKISQDIFKDYGTRLRQIELWAAKKNDPDFK